MTTEIKLGDFVRTNDKYPGRKELRNLKVCAITYELYGTIISVERTPKSGKTYQQKIAREFLEQEGFLSLNEKSCPNCQGKGQFENPKGAILNCGLCNGTGRVK